MRNLLFAFSVALALSACAASKPQPIAEDCCNNKEIIYVDKPKAECTRAVQKVTQVAPCAACSNFQLSARAESICGQEGITQK